MSVDLARALIDSQRPDLSGREIVSLGEGWDNWSYRLGDDLLIRLPRRAMAAPLIEKEWEWLGHLAPSLSLGIPVPIFLGKPSHGYPFNWAIYPYLNGRPASQARPSDMRETARTVARFLTDLHQAGPPEAPANPFRGGPLVDRDRATRERIETLRGEGYLLADELGRIWDDAVNVPEFEEAPVWVHGDFHPHNLLVDEERLTAVVDWGDVTVGDPAVDLSIGWIMFAEHDRQFLRSEYGRPSDELWERSRGWALSLGLAMMMTSEDNQIMHDIGRRAIDAVLEDRSPRGVNP